MMFRSGRLFAPALCRGEVHIESRAHADLAIDRYKTVVLSDDAMNNRQAESGTFTNLLGSKKRVEDAIDGRRIHSGSRIAHAGEYKSPGFCGYMVLYILFVYEDIPCADGQTTPVRHCIPGIDAQVHEHLIDLSGINRDKLQFGIGLEVEMDMFSKRLVQEFEQVGKMKIEIYRFGFDHLATRERQQLLGDPGSSVG